jgi:hypothetical protein
VPVGKLKKIWKKIFFAFLKSMKKGVGSGSGSISQSYGSGSAPKCHGSPTLVRGALVHKRGRKYQHLLIVSPVYSIKHQYRRHLGFGVFIDILSMDLILHCYVLSVIRIRNHPGLWDRFAPGPEIEVIEIILAKVSSLCQLSSQSRGFLSRLDF